MELLQLKYFCDAAETENFSKTAEKYRVPPSNISQSIKRLEKELNIPLFNRGANRIELNEQGKLFYTEVKNALIIIENAKNSLVAEENKAIKINIHTDRRIVMNAIEEFQKLFGDIDIIIDFSNDFKNTDTDIIVTGQQINDLNFENIITGSEKILLSYKNDIFAQKEEISVEEIKTKPFITMSKGHSHYDLTCKICGEFGFVPRIAIQSDDPFYIRQCVELGLGIAFVPELSWRGQFSDNVILKSIGNYSRSIYVYKNKGCYSAENINAFIKLLSAELNK